MAPDAAIAEDMTEEERIILSSVDKFIEQDVRPYAHDLEAKDEYPREIADKMAELGLMKDAGAKAVATGRQWIADSGTMFRIMQYCAMLDLPLIAHAEDGGLALGDAGGAADRYREPAAQHRRGCRLLPRSRHGAAGGRARGAPNRSAAGGSVPLLARGAARRLPAVIG